MRNDLEKMPRELELIENCQKISIYPLMKEQGWSKEEMCHYVENDYVFELGVKCEDGQVYDQNIRFTYTRLFFGKKIHFKCECGRSVQDLYLRQDATRFLCRFCHRLKYSSSYLKGGMYHGLIGVLNKRKRRVKKMLDKKVRKTTKYYELKSEYNLLNEVIIKNQVKYLLKKLSNND